MKFICKTNKAGIGDKTQRPGMKALSYFKFEIKIAPSREGKGVLKAEPVQNFVIF